MRCCATTASISARTTTWGRSNREKGRGRGVVMTPPVHDLPLFMLAALLVNLTPGPDMLFVIGNSAAHGRRAGVMASLGIGAGCVLHMLLAAAGLSALLAASALAFE